MWVGTLIPPESNILILAEKLQVNCAVIRLGRMGYEKIQGYLTGSFEAWKKAKLPITEVKTLKSVNDFKIKYEKGIKVIDIRSRAEVSELGIVKGAINYPL